MDLWFGKGSNLSVGSRFLTVFNHPRCFLLKSLSILIRRSYFFVSSVKVMWTSCVLCFQKTLLQNIVSSPSLFRHILFHHPFRPFYQLEAKKRNYWRPKKKRKRWPVHWPKKHNFPKGKIQRSLSLLMPALLWWKWKWQQQQQQQHFNTTAVARPKKQSQQVFLQKLAFTTWGWEPSFQGAGCKAWFVL